MSVRPDLDIAIIGGSAAGLATAIFARRRDSRVRVGIFEGARHPGAKILVSGGSRCNVTNVSVTERDFNGGRPSAIRHVLRRFPVAETVDFFRELNVPLHEEAAGKLFPDSNSSRDVLTALLREVDRRGAALHAGHRVIDVTRHEGAFVVSTPAATVTAGAVVLATGGLALPKSGSDGWGYGVATRLGHSIVPTTPALVPLTLAAPTDTGESWHAALSGVAHPAELALRVDGRIASKITGPLLWTHFGISGPAVLDVSRHWLRARLDRREGQLTLNFIPGASFEEIEHMWVALTRDHPRLGIQAALAERLPGSLAEALRLRLSLTSVPSLGELSRERRRALVHALVGWPLEVTGSRGYAYAEATAGGVSLAEIDPGSMASRLCDGLFLVGEVLDVDGRLGGFNFQWAWASGRVAGEGAAARTLGDLKT